MEIKYFNINKKQTVWNNSINNTNYDEKIDDDLSFKN